MRTTTELNPSLTSLLCLSPRLGVEQNGEWSLMCPAECTGLAETYGDEFEALYERYEKEGKVKRTVKAQKLWHAILEAQTETGQWAA